MQARVLLVSSEAVPLVKTGGLADVITALAVSLRKCNIDASILMPGYAAALDGLAASSAQAPQIINLPKALPGGPGRLVQATMPGTDVPLLLLDTERFSQRRANPYIDQSGQEFCDNAICFADLAHAAVAICAGETSLPAPHVVHANDWHAGLIPFLLKSAGLHHVASMLTIHNLAFQGNYGFDLAAQLGLAQVAPEHLASLEYWGKISYLKAGIQHADCVTTVSKTYAAEILTPRFGYGMEGVLNARREVLRAIPNGIDSAAWDPQNDPLTAAPFSIGQLRGKALCKADLQSLFGLLPVNPFAPILGIGSRMSHQKMADVALQALPSMLDRHEHLQLVVLGCGERSYEEGFAALAQRYPGRVGVHIGYDERRAHALHAGSDMLLHASRFEPFGLTPLYSMRYGTIPIASRVGGLTDTIADAGAHGRAAEGASGVLFDGDSAADMCAAVQRAFDLYADRAQWQTMQDNAMRTDFDWQTAAAAYIEAYQQIAAGEGRLAFRTALTGSATASSGNASSTGTVARAA